MSVPRVFLAWSTQVDSGAGALVKALEIVKTELAGRGYEVYNWNEQPHNRNINKEVEEKIRGSDMLILESTTDRPNPAFEMGFARYADLPIIVLKQEGSKELPADFGAPRYLIYPTDVGKEDRFMRFRQELNALLDRLEAETFSPGHRALRRALSAFVANVTETSNHYVGDHPQLYFMNGWIDALAGDFRAGGPSMIMADADYYVHMFGALQERGDMHFRAIADLTDSTEPFWELEHPEPLSTPGSERIFLVDWRLFFEREAELAAYVDTWSDHLITNSDYSIYVVTDSDIDATLRHPLGRDAVGRHLLLVHPGEAFGGYRFRVNRDIGRLFHLETDSYRFRHAEKFYQSVRSRAVKLEPGHTFVDLKREWLRQHQVGTWSPEWTHQTERRSARYFARYDQHIRCWVPSYDAMIGETAAMVAREALRVHEQSNRPVKLLEIGYGTGSLTSKVGPWITQLGEPFVTFGHLPPVEYYHAVDRADQMRSIAARNLARATTDNEVKLLRQVAWREVRDDIRYDVIFGSLVTHFMIERADAGSADRFFAACAQRLGPDGSLIFADSFGPADGDLAGARARWREWMIGDGLSEASADGFLDGNQDMLEAPSIAELVEAAAKHGFELAESRAPSSTSLFAVVSFRRIPDAEAVNILLT